MPYFNTPDLEGLVVDVKNTCDGIDPIPCEVGDIDYYGSKKKIKVNKVIDSDELTGLHKKLFDVAKTYDRNFASRFCFPNYQPHITHNIKPYPHKGEVSVINEICLVKDLGLKTKEKQIVARFGLK